MGRRSARGRFGELRALLAAIVLASISQAAGTAAHAACQPDIVTIEGKFGKARFTVEVADEPAERSRGLMFVEEMGRFEGMLFVYEQPQRASFWMRNTLIPLDMLFAGSDGTVTRIHREAIPLDETPIPGGNAVQFVLEINGGLAERLGIEEGAIMQHPAIGPDAALPCP